MRPFKTVSLRENVLRRNVVREIDINSFMFYTHLYFDTVLRDFLSISYELTTSVAATGILSPLSCKENTVRPEPLGIASQLPSF